MEIIKYNIIQLSLRFHISAATRVIEWAKHILDDSALTLKRPESPKTTTPAVAEPPMAEEKSYTIEVSGISPDTTKDALFNFFENKRRSGGGRVEDIQYYEDDGLAEITFSFSEGLFICSCAC